MQVKLILKLNNAQHQIMCHHTQIHTLRLKILQSVACFHKMALADLTMNKDILSTWSEVYPSYIFLRTAEPVGYREHACSGVKDSSATPNADLRRSRPLFLSN